MAPGSPGTGGLGRLTRIGGRLIVAALFVAGIAALLMLLAGVFEKKVRVEPQPAAGQLPNPSAGQPQALVQRIRRPRQESAVGTIRAVSEAVVASKLLARVEEVRIRAGQEVAQGDVLIVLDKADLKARIEQTEAAEAAAKAKSDQAELELGRAQRLRDRQSITQSELDLATTASRTAKAELDRAHRSVEETRIIEQYATVRAPISGRIIDKRVNVGDTVTQGQPLVTMYDPTHMQMIVTVRESLALGLKVGQVIPARLESFDYECQATVSEIVPEAQAESRSFQVKVTGPCPPNVYSGMFGRIFIPLEDEDLLVVPPEAIRRVGQLDEVDVVDGNAVRRRSVQLGRTLAEGREVLSGLVEGERVLLVHSATTEQGSGRHE